MSACNDYAVELKGVTFKRGERSIFDNVDIAIPRGKVTAIMGPSGCGKTTLLRLIAAQLMPARGEVWVAGNNLPSPAQRAVRHAQADGRVVPERSSVHRSRRVRERRLRCACIPGCLTK